TTPTFTAAQTFGLGPNTGIVVAADFNGDGKPDLAVIVQGTNSVAVLANTTATGSNTVSFALPQGYAVGNRPEGLAAGDLNGDNKPDLVVTNGADNTVSVLLNTTTSGSPSFAAPQTFAVGASPSAVTVADPNGDNKP